MLTHKVTAGRVRACVEADLPRLVELHRRVWGPSPALPRAEFTAYLGEILFDNPCIDGGLPSLVYEDAEGTITGCLGVMPRRMWWKKRRIVVAISHNFMVEPGSRSTLAGVQLLKTFFAGSQDLSIAEGNTASRRVWEGLGGSTALLYSLRWSRPLRPSRYLLALLAKRGFAGPLASAVRPLCGAVDALVGRALARPAGPGEVLGEELASDVLRGSLPRMVGELALWPDYDERSLRWLLDLAARKPGHGPLRKIVVREGPDRALGWYLYYARPGGVSEVVQIGATEATAGLVLDHLFHDAWRQGAIAVSGPMEPRFLQVLSDKYCVFRDGGAWMLVHSRHSDLVHAIQRGDAFLSRLDGEWWINL